MGEAAESAPRLRTPVNEHACAVAVVSAEAELSLAQIKAQPVASRLYQRLYSTTRVSRIDFDILFPSARHTFALSKLVRLFWVLRVHAWRRRCMLSVPLCEWIRTKAWDGNAMLPTSLRLQCRRNSSSFSLVVCPAPLMTSH